MNYNHRDFVTKRGIACMDCHSDVLSGSGNVEQDRCFTCHNQPEKIARFKDIPFIHDNHVTKHHVACFHCHEPMRHGSGAGISSAAEALGKPGARPATRPRWCSSAPRATRTSTSARARCTPATPPPSACR